MSEMIEIGALWEGETREGKIYMAGKLGDSNRARLLMFSNDSENPKAPQWRLFLAPNRPREESGGQKEQKGQSAPRKNMRVEPMSDSSDYSEVPF